MKKRKKTTNTLDDYLKASRRGSREGERDALGPGFHATTRVHRSKKDYTRKTKHRTDFSE